MMRTTDDARQEMQRATADSDLWGLQVSPRAQARVVAVVGDGGGRGSMTTNLGLANVRV